MSNGATSVFISVMTIAGSSSATTPREKSLVAWLAAHDQGFLGAGTVGFHLDEMPWDEEFEADMQFWQRTTDAAKEERGWDCLDGNINKEWAHSYVAKFRSLLDRFNSSMVRRELPEYGV